MLDRRPPGLEFAGRVRVRRLQPPFGDLKETRGARVERLRGQGLEALRELAFDQRGAVGRDPLDQSITSRVRTDATPRSQRARGHRSRS